MKESAGNIIRKFTKVSIIVFVVIIILWTILTFWVESPGPGKTISMGNSGAKFNALIIYDPDPIYNLDEEVCKSFAQALAASGIRVTLSTVAAARGSNNPSFDLYVFCANTYNWYPDWAVTAFIENINISGKPVVAITVGAGSTDHAQKILETIILNGHGQLVSSKAFWLMRPNDEGRLKEENVNVAATMAYSWATRIAQQMQSK